MKKISAYFAKMIKKNKYKIIRILWDWKQNHVANAMILMYIKMVYVFIVTINNILMIIYSHNNATRMNFQLEQNKNQYLIQVLKPDYVNFVVNNKNISL